MEILSISENETLLINEGERLEVRRLNTDGDIQGGGTLALDWNQPITGIGEISQNIQYEEMRIPELNYYIIPSATSVYISVQDIGATQYVAKVLGGQEEALPDGSGVITGLQSGITYTITIKATNSRGNTIMSAEMVTTFYLASRLYLIKTLTLEAIPFGMCQNIGLYAQIRAFDTGDILPMEAVDKISYTCFKLQGFISYKLHLNSVNHGMKVIDGFENVEVPVSDVLYSQFQNDANWVRDDYGYNFLLIPDQTQKIIFQAPGFYYIEVKLTFDESLTQTPMNTIIFGYYIEIL